VFKKAAVFSLLFLVGAGLGLFGGWKLSSSRERARERRPFDDLKGTDFIRTYDLIARLWELDRGSQLRLQDPKYGVKGSQEFLHLILDTAQNGRIRVTDPAALTMIDVETGITYIRLAMMEEAAGNLPASQTSMQKAQTTLKQAGWKDYSEAHLKEVVQALNKRDSLCCSR
jgi:hypothetical protein